jgi:hypothetical protein
MQTCVLSTSRLPSLEEAHDTRPTVAPLEAGQRKQNCPVEPTILHDMNGNSRAMFLKQLKCIDIFLIFKELCFIELSEIAETACYILKLSQ